MPVHRYMLPKGALTSAEKLRQSKEREEEYFRKCVRGAAWWMGLAAALSATGVHCPPNGLLGPLLTSRCFGPRFSLKISTENFRATKRMYRAR